MKITETQDNIKASGLLELANEIAANSYTAIDLRNNEQELKCQIADIHHQIDREIAFSDFKNDAQRKAARFDMLQNDHKLSELNAKVSVIEEYIERNNIRNTLLRDLISIKKLERREAIAQMECQASISASW